MWVVNGIQGQSPVGKINRLIAGQNKFNSRVHERIRFDNQFFRIVAKITQNHHCTIS